MLTSLTCIKGDVEGNLARHRELMASAGDHGCDLALLPEMSLTGYRPSAAVALDHMSVTELVAATSHGPALCFGLAETDDTGGQPFITQLIADHGRIVAVHRKSHLGEGEDTEFQPGTAADAFMLADASCVVAVCAEIGAVRPYGHDGVRVVLGPSAPGLYGDRRRTEADWRRGWDWWRGSVIGDAARLLRRDQVLVVSTQAGATDDEDFPGWAAVLEPGGTVTAELPDWREGTLIVEV
jgi:predicted amidohydrolase